MTDHVITGPRESVKAIYNKMVELRNRPKPLVWSDFGNTWLGCLVAAFGGDCDEVPCRGSWGNEKFNDEDCTLTFWTDYAWAPPFEFLQFLKGKFPGIKSYLISEEEMMGEYFNNDINGHYFTEKYVLRNGEEEFYASYQSEQKLIEAIREHTPFKDVGSISEFEAAVSQYDSTHEEGCYWSCEVYKLPDKEYIEL